MLEELWGGSGRAIGSWRGAGEGLEGRWERAEETGSGGGRESLSANKGRSRTFPAGVEGFSLRNVRHRDRGREGLGLEVLHKSSKTRFWGIDDLQ